MCIRDSTQAVSQAQKTIDSYASKHGLDQSQSARILGMAEMAAQNPKALDLVSPVSIKAAAQVAGTSEATAKQLLESAKSYAVSYTHLDVYKRQIFYSASFIENVRR